MININRHGSEENYGIDRISSLPDEARTHILSFLSTRQAVQTCILSKRWINTWAYVLDLEFDIEELGLRKIFDGEMAVAEFVTKFEVLVKSVLQKRETSCVNRFRLWLDYGFYWPPTQAVADCIGDVMKLEPRECLVNVGPCENLNLNTDLIFTCASLTDLQIWFSSIKNHNLQAIEPNSVNLPCLKTLVLYGVRISDDTFKKLLLGCPVLEELVLERYYIKIIEIRSNTLKKLRLCNLYDGMNLRISTPNLLCFNIGVLDMGNILLLNMPSLVDASICINGWPDQWAYVPKAVKLIHSLSNVESLQLELDCLEGMVLKKEFYCCPVFNNLKRLKLVISMSLIFELAPYFLYHSPKLQELTLENNNSWVREILDMETTWEGPRDALVQREFLKSVKIVGFEKYKSFVDWLINKLLTHVKIIGEIIV